jgi:antitoxin FitA
MSTNITLKNISDEIYDSFRSAAELYRRSINSKIIACLERVLMTKKITNEMHLTEAHQIRHELKGKKFRVADIEKTIDQGRPRSSLIVM